MQNVTGLDGDGQEKFLSVPVDCCVFVISQRICTRFGGVIETMALLRA